MQKTTTETTEQINKETSSSITTTTIGSVSNKLIMELKISTPASSTWQFLANKHGKKYNSASIVQWEE